jgi:hypothetical protein
MIMFESKEQVLNNRERELEELIQSMTPFQRRCHLRQKRPLESPFLYKYRALDPNDSQSVSRVKEVLLESNLWLSPPSDFNDPFDMAAKIVFEGTTSSKRERITRLVKAQSGNLNFKARALHVTQIMTKAATLLPNLLQLAQDQTVQNIGVCSFAGDPRSILMWSHYAANHSGICIQVERSRDPVLAFGALPVEYSDEYPKVNWTTDSSSETVKVLLRKHIGWSYEKENRFIRPLAANTKLTFVPRALVGVILGCRIAPQSQELIHEIHRERVSNGLPGFRIYKAQKHAHRYELNVFIGRQ